jgi:hypothetical protein
MYYTEWLGFLSLITTTARVLRFLATRHIFKEISPDVFANNRLSSLLVKAKSFEEILAE